MSAYWAGKFPFIFNPKRRWYFFHPSGNWIDAMQVCNQVAELHWCWHLLKHQMLFTTIKNSLGSSPRQQQQPNASVRFLCFHLAATVFIRPWHSNHSCISTNPKQKQNLQLQLMESMSNGAIDSAIWYSYRPMRNRHVDTGRCIIQNSEQLYRKLRPVDQADACKYLRFWKHAGTVTRVCNAPDADSVHWKKKKR